MKVERVWIILICLMMLFLCQCGRTKIPEELIGVWETTAPDYADHPFEITTREVIFGTGEGTFDAYPIARIKIEEDVKEQKTLYIICYKNTARQEYKFSFYYDSTNRGAIRFKNQKEMVWTKKPLPPSS